MAYHPGKNSLFIPYNDQCLDMTADNSKPGGFGPRDGILRPGGDPQKFGGLARVNMATGKIEWRYTQHAPTNGAVLATAGDLIFWGGFEPEIQGVRCRYRESTLGVNYDPFK